MPRLNVPNRFRVTAFQHAELQATMLIDFLNAAESRDLSRHAEGVKVFRLCLDLDALRKVAPAKYTIQENAEIWTFIRQRESLLKSINETLGAFQFTPELSGGHTAWERYAIHWLPVCPPEDKTGVIPAVSAIRLAMEMLVNGTLERVRLCSCGRWFFAASNKKVACTDGCRFKRFLGDRTTYMKQYRSNAIVRKRIKVKANKKKPSAAKKQP